MEDLSNRIKDDKAINILKGIFNNINGWLIFAETKNGVLLSINSLFLFRLLDCLKERTSSNVSMNRRMIWILIAIFSVEIIIILKSFFPNCSTVVDKNTSTNETNCGDSRIIMFYGDISKYESSKLYVQDIYRCYLDINIDIENISKYELDYAKEIIMNSKIACYKYKCFKDALLLNGLGIFLCILFFFVS